MKLSLLTYQLGKDLALEELLAIVNEAELDGLELRAELGHKHGVELERTQQERAQIKAAAEAAQVPLVCLATGCKFESPDPDERAEQVARGKEFMDLARDIGAPRIRVFGNAFPQGSDREQVIGNVGDCLRELGDYAEEVGVEVGLEMHGDFYYWEHALRAVQLADRPRVNIVYNSDPRELQHGPLADTLPHVLPYIKHVHLHDCEDGRFPYKEAFRLLSAAGYDGYMSLECSPSADPQRVIKLYAALFREYLAQV